MSSLNINSENPKLPQSLKKYFWDCPFSNLSPDNHSFFITERLIRFGNQDSIKWLLKNIDNNVLQNVVEKSRNLDPKTKNYWEIMLYG